MEQLVDESGNRFWLVVVPGDGNCLFGSIAHLIYGITPKHPLFESYCLETRVAAVSEIRNNIAYYYAQVEAHAAEEFRDYDWSTANKVERYLGSLEISGFWGGEESISALANHFQVVFVVHQENGSKIEFEPAHSESDGLPRYHLYYRVFTPPPAFDSHVSSDFPSTLIAHYDSVLFLREARSTLESIPRENIELPSLSYPVRMKWYRGDDALLCSLVHQLTRADASNETLYLLRCLVADELESHPTLSVPSSGIACSPEDVSRISLRLRNGYLDEDRASLVILAELLKINLFVHNRHEEDALCYKPTVCRAVVNVHLVLDSCQSVYGSIFSAFEAPVIRRRRLSDPMAVAQKAARKELTDSQLSEPLTVIIHPTQGLRFASLNVNGCRGEDKREAIDCLLLFEGVHIAVLQEVNLDCLYAATSNFRWHMGGLSKSRKRGLAILIRNGLGAEIVRSICTKPDIQHAEIRYQVGTSFRTLNLINVHGPNHNADRFFAVLGTVVGGVLDSRTLLVAGDFNSHLSCSNLSPEESQLIGRFAGHAEFNENGTQMRIFLGLNRLAVRSTQMNSNHGFRWTWTNERLRSQVDHFLTHLHSGVYLKRLRAFRPSALSTDHKLLCCSIVEKQSFPPPSLNRAAKFESNKRKCLEPALLKVPEIQAKFHEQLSSKAVVLDPHSSVDQNWEKFRDKCKADIIVKCKINNAYMAHDFPK